MQKCCNHLKLNTRKAEDNQQTQLPASKTKPCSKSNLKGVSLFTNKGHFALISKKRYQLQKIEYI
jgi:hypothetical protein